MNLSVVVRTVGACVAALTFAVLTACGSNQQPVQAVTTATVTATQTKYNTPVAGFMVTSRYNALKACLPMSAPSITAGDLKLDGLLFLPGLRQADHENPVCAGYVGGTTNHRDCTILFDKTGAKEADHKGVTILKYNNGAPTMVYRFEQSGDDATSLINQQCSTS